MSKIIELNTTVYVKQNYKMLSGTTNPDSYYYFEGIVVGYITDLKSNLKYYKVKNNYSTDIHDIPSNQVVKVENWENDIDQIKIEK